MACAGDDMLGRSRIAPISACGRLVSVLFQRRFSQSATARPVPKCHGLSFSGAMRR
jgi:hypothetical protein